MAVAVGRGGAGLLRPGGAVSSFVLLGLMIGLGYIGVNLLYARVQPSSEQILGSLTDARFTQPLPTVLADARIDIRSNEEENYVSVALNTAVEPEGFEGDEARISYLVFDRAAVASRQFEEALEGARLQAQREEVVVEESFEFDPLPVSERNYCFGYGKRLHYCQILVGSVWIDVTSHLETAGISDDPHFPELARAALTHLRAAVPGID